MTIGVLALQGDVSEHGDVLESLDMQWKPVRTREDAESLNGLVIPGGESTVMARLLESEHLVLPLTERFRSGDLPVLGTCAGAILLARYIDGKNPPRPLGLLDITLERNAYGTQRESFATDLEVKGIGRKRASFIRAPRITWVGPGIEVLAEHDGSPVLVRSGKIIASTFHTEVWQDQWLHEMAFGSLAEH